VEDEVDEEFWKQEFFMEEENDERYETENEPENQFDADFNESEDEEDEEAEAAEAEAEAKSREAKKKVLKPPGYKKPPLPKPKPKPDESGGAPAAKKKRASIGPEDFQVGRRTVRESTRQKVEEGEMERKLAEKYKPKRAPARSSHYRPLTQAELLAEAARTEIENTKSLELLVLIEEETKKKAQVSKRRYAGPMVRWKSRRVGDAELGTLEIRNMAMPDEMRHRTAPAPTARPSFTGRRTTKWHPKLTQAKKLLFS
jgi:vacuolar protein sorting-associated protein 72